MDEPLPHFDVASGALGGLSLGDAVEQAEFLGRPDRVEHTSVSGMTFHYLGRGFELQFSVDLFVELRCHIAARSDAPPEAGRGFSRPRLSSGIQITPEMSVAQVYQVFGPPEREEIDAREKTWFTGASATWCSSLKRRRDDY